MPIKALNCAHMILPEIGYLRDNLSAITPPRNDPNAHPAAKRPTRVAALLWSKPAVQTKGLQALQRYNATSTCMSETRYSYLFL